MAARRGDTLLFERMPVIASHAAVGGKKEGEGPLAAEFDELFPDNNCGQANWETAEKILQLRAVRLCLKKAHATEKQVSLVLAGDLQAQCTASSYALRELHYRRSALQTGPMAESHRRCRIYTRSRTVASRHSRRGIPLSNEYRYQEKLYD